MAGRRGSGKPGSAGAGGAGGGAPALRRAPVQERARRQVQRILDAAAARVGEAGIEALTTNAVAAHAGVSVGSLYQYFPNKDALVRALAARFIEELDRRLPVPPGDDPSAWSLPAEVGRAVTVLADFIEEHPAYLHVYRAARATGDVEGTRLLDRGKAHFEQVFARRAPWVPAAERRAHAMVAVETAHALLVVASTRGPTARRRVVRELNTLLVRYLAPEYGGGTA